MIAIVDYGVGNLFSLRCSLNAIGEDAVVTSEKEILHNADRIILPGVGAFADAARKLRESGLDIVVKDEAARGKKLLGICLGMQMLFEESLENGIYEGLGLIPGSVRPIAEVIPDNMKIPHIGWNKLILKGNSPLYNHVENGEHVYFVHSYHAVTDDKFILAKTEYGSLLTASVAKGNVYGCQFHPEKSGETGLNILKGFCAL